MGRRRISLCVAVLLLAGCAPSSYPVRAPLPSGLRYESTARAQPLELALVDLRPSGERVFHSGVLKATLLVDAAPIDPPRFLAEQVQAELASRGLDVKVTQGGTAPSRIELRTFCMQNYRKNGYTAYFTSTFISADLVTPSLKKRLGVFVRRGKLPMWSFDEVVEPTMNQPLSLAVKEFATKLANALYGYRAPDATVRELLARIERGRDDATYLDVYQLGFTNNPLAVETLAKLARDDSEYVRIAAISSLGTLRATSQLALLRGLHADRDVLWQERAMALKSIGDLDVPEGNAFLRSEQDRLAPQNDTGSLWWKQVLALYL